MLDLRRFEIITLGSMPFITLNSSIVYNNSTIKDPALSKYKKMLPHLSPDLNIYPKDVHLHKCQVSLSHA